MLDFQGKVAVITGAGSGIGRALAHLFASKGCHLVLADIQLNALQQVEAELAGSAGRIVLQPCNVMQEGDVQALADTAFNTFGAVHLLFNNAGVITGGPLWECSLADYDWVIGVNVYGIIHAIRAFVPRLIAQTEPSHIVNTASMAAHTAMPFAGIYHSSKSMAAMLSESLYHDLSLTAPQVKVSVLCPEFVQTGIANAVQHRPQTHPSTAIPESREMVLQMLADAAHGADSVTPDAIAERVLAAIQAEQFWILANKGDKWLDCAMTRQDDIRQLRNPTLQTPF